VTVWIGAALTCVLSALMCLVLIWLGPKDAPDGERKQQARAVPTAGGVAIFGSVFLVAMATSLSTYDVERLYNQINLDGILPFLTLLLITFAVGLMDDWLTVPTSGKLGGFLVLSLVTTFWALHGVSANFSFPWMDIVLSPFVTTLGAALWIFVFANASNFMDGSNGLAMGCLAIMLGTLGYLANVSTDLFGLGGLEELQLLIILMVSAVIGFLILNIRGQIYAGDAGSLTMGTLFAVVSLLMLIYLDWGRLQVWTPATLALPFLIDVLLTLVWRARRKKNLLQGHLDHAYQLFRRAGWGHLQVAILWWSMTAICALVAVFADRAGGSLPFWGWLGLLFLGCTAWAWQRQAYGPRVEAI